MRKLVRCIPLSLQIVTDDFHSSPFCCRHESRRPTIRGREVSQLSIPLSHMREVSHLIQSPFPPVSLQTTNLTRVPGLLVFLNASILARPTAMMVCRSRRLQQITCAMLQCCHACHLPQGHAPICSPLSVSTWILGAWCKRSFVDALIPRRDSGYRELEL